MQSPPFPRYLVPPRSKYFPQHPVLKHPQLPFLQQRQRPSFTPIQNNRQNYPTYCTLCNKFNKSYLLITNYVYQYVYKYGYSREVSSVSCCTEDVSLVLTLSQIECGKLFHTDWLLTCGFKIGDQKNHI